MRRPRILIVAGIAVMGLAAFLAAQAGLIDTGRLFGLALASTTGVEVPDLDDTAMIRRGAGHYERVCASCHASPERPRRGEALNFTPPAPKLHDRLGERPPESLFFTVRDGVRGTAMPAWPAPFREDEVWDMVAFLQVLPQLDAQAYRKLTGSADLPAGLTPMLADCARCHGEDGRGHPDGSFPRLDIQTPTYLELTLRAFRDGQRASGFMQAAVAGLTDAELADLAAHFGQQADAGDEADASLASDDATRRPACIACHGSPRPIRDEFPTLSGQYEPYITLQLGLFADEDERRGGTAFSPLMHEVARSLSEPASTVE